MKGELEETQAAAHDTRVCGSRRAAAAWPDPPGRGAYLLSEGSAGRSDPVLVVVVG